MNLVRLSIDRPVTTTMGILFFIVMGIFAYYRVPLDMLPRVDFPVITIVTVYPGAGPSNIETLVSKPIEEAVSSINGINMLRSMSLEGFSNVLIEFHDTVDVDVAANDVRDKISAIRADLPGEIKEPIIMKLDINALPIISLAVEGPQAIEEIYRFVVDVVKDELVKVPGVADIEIIGNREREILMQIPLQHLKAYGLSINSVAGILAQRSHDIPSGHITADRTEFSVRMQGEFASIDEIRSLPIPLRNGKMIPLSAIATIEDTFEELRQSVRLNGKNAIGLVIKKRSDANTVQMSHGVQALIKALSARMPEGMAISMTRNRADFIEDSVADLNSNMIMGVIITGIVLLLFLHSFKTMLIAVVSLPVAIIGSYILIYAFNFTINILTLMALAISVGILVNNAIIVMENIIIHLKRGKTPKLAAEDGTNEILVAVTGATLTNVVVFLPIAFMTGMVGRMFYEFGLTVTFATFLSLLVAFTMTPMLCARFLTLADADDSKKGRFATLWNRAYTSLENDYRESLKWCLMHKKSTIAAGLIILFATFPLASYIGFEFVTEPDQKEFDITIKMPPGTSLSETDSVLRRIEAEISTLPFVRFIYTKLGKTEVLVGGSSEGVNRGEVTVKLDPGHRDHTRDVIGKLTPFLAELPDVELSVRPTGLMGSNESPIQIFITGDDLGLLQKYSGQVMDIMSKVRGIRDVRTSLETGKPEISIIPDRERLARHGLTELGLAMQLRGYFEGDITTKYRELDDEYNIRIRLEGDVRQDSDRISELLVSLPSGQTVPLTGVARIVTTTGPAQIDRFNRSRAIQLSANVAGNTLGEVVQDIRAGVEKLNLPTDYQVFYTGEIERMEESFQSLFIAMLQALIFTYMLLATLLESFVHPLTILLSFPMAFAGIILSMFLTGHSMSIFALMAVVMLVGIVVNNGILILEQIKLLRTEGMEFEEAIIEGCPQKLRPIIMTAAATICAMIPLALGLGAGGEMRAPMAVISIGGLLASTLLSLFLIPITYHIVEQLTNGKPHDKREPYGDRHHHQSMPR